MKPEIMYHWNLAERAVCLHTLPIDALPVSSNVTIRPEIVRLFESAAVICIGVITFLLIATYLLPRVFRRSTLRRYDLRFHKPARARKGYRVGSRLNQTRHDFQQG